MPRIAIDPAGLADELAAFDRALAKGLGVLRRNADVHGGATARTAVFTQDDVTLYRYGDGTGRPLLVVYALVNRPDMLDLQTGRSVIAELVRHGFDVYLIDWGYPGGADRLRSLGDYIDRYLNACVDHVLDVRGRDRLTMLGVCQGGTLAVCYSALYPDKIERLITSVTPVDFHTPDDMLSHLVRGVDIDALLDAHGNVNGDVLNWLFLSLKPFRLTQQKYVDFLRSLDRPEAVATFLRMERWIFDSPALAGAAIREYARDFYQQNRLAAGTLEIGGRPINLGRLTMPILNIYASADHLVPPAASQALGRLCGSHAYSEVALPGGHIGIYVVGTGAGKRTLPTAVAEWMATA